MKGKKGRGRKQMAACGGTKASGEKNTANHTGKKEERRTWILKQK